MTRTATVRYISLTAVLVLLSAFILQLYPALLSTLAIQGLPRAIQRSFQTARTTLAPLTASMATSVGTNGTKPPRTPVYFLSHGGPNTMYEKDHPVYPQLQAIGHEITSKVRPKAVVVFSAHWQAERPNTIEVNVSENEPLLYDFYGFPRHYYMEKYPNRGSKEVADRVMSLLGESGIKTEAVDRGLDHGVFVCFKVAFDPESNPLGVPIVQVSLFDDESDPAKHIALGRAVKKLREEGVLIVVSGMAVHNLREMGRGMMMGRPLDYAISFDEALRGAVECEPGNSRDEEMVKLFGRKDMRRAHPTAEHLLPAHVGVGAAGEDWGKRLWTMPEGSMSWAQYRWGDVEA